MVEMKKTRVANKMAVQLISNGNGDVVAMIHRDSVSKKTLIYKVVEACSEEIAELIQTVELGVKNNPDEK